MTDQRVTMGDTHKPRRQPLVGATIGYGFIASKGHVPAYASFPQDSAPLRIAAVADICPARREAARQAIPGVRVYESHGELLEKEAGRLDFVDITTPPS